MSHRNRIRRSVLLGSAATLLAGSIAGVGSLAYAQDQDDDAIIEEIIVTGTRLKNTAVSSPVPILQISADQISDRGVVRLEEMLNIMPQVEVSQNANISNGASGTSTVDLRGLGATRTLVLVNGRRLPFGSPRSSAPNIDIIPAALIDRIDIVTGGGSAVYGSDAVGGIVNFLLKNDFEGMEFNGQVGVHHAPNNSNLMSDILTAANIGIPGAKIDGREVALSFTMGANFDDGRGNVTLHVGYQNANAISQNDRIFSKCALSSGSGVNGNQLCAGSSNFRKFTPGVDGDRLRHINGRVLRPGDPEFLQVINSSGTIFSPGDAGYDALFFGSDGVTPTEANRLAGGFAEVFQEADGTLVVRGTSAEAETFNFGPTNFFRRPNERYNINALGHYQITESIEAYVDLSFMNNFTNAQIAPSASFNRAFDTSCSNPLLQNGAGTLVPGGPNDSQILTLFELFDCATVQAEVAAGTRTDDVIRFTNSHRNVEGGNRNLAFDNTQWRVVTGLRGTLAEQWDWDLFGQISRVTETRSSTNDLSFNRVQQALFVIDDPNNPGTLICDPARNPEAGCVPWNITNRTASGDTLVTQEASDFIAGRGIVIGQTEQRVIGGTIQSDLTDYGFKLPWAEGGASILGGFEYRRDSLESNPDDVSRTIGGLTGTGGATLPVEGKISVWELFMEAQIPLVQNVTGIEELSLSGAYRHSEYSSDGNGVSNSFGTNTFFIGGSWTPISQIRFRAQFQRAIRAPSVIALFTGKNTGLVRAVQLSNGAFDPCGGPVPAATLAQCQNTGLSAAQFGTVPLQPAGQLNTVTGGNPNLFAETSDTITLGVIITPDLIPGLTIAVDYYDITIDDAISTIPPQTTLDECIATGNPVFCNLIVRDRFGSLWLDGSNFEGIQATNVNIATLDREGVDVQIDYDMDLDMIGLDGMGSVNFSLAATRVITDSFVPLPGEATINCNGLFAGQCDPPNAKYRHVLRSTWNTPWDFRTTLTWRYTGGIDNSGTISDPTDLNLRVPSASYIDVVFRYQIREAFEARFGINNLLAKNPHFAAAGTNGNVFEGQYDLDRFMFFGVNITY